MTTLLDTQQDVDQLLAKLVDEITLTLQAGEPVELEDYAVDYPNQIEQLRGLLPALQVLAGIGQGAVLGHQSPLGVPGGEASEREQNGECGVLGDYRIRREIGRGGMGVVYEAEQISLGRRVALKMLPFAAVLDPKQHQRFKNEAQAAAHLKHPNIVGVYSVGCERGVHYYAMEYIEGADLAELIEQLRPPSEPRADDSGEEAGAIRRLACDLTTGRLCAQAPTSRFDDPPGPQPTAARSTICGADETPPDAEAVLSPGSASTRSREFFRAVAQLGIQAAHALEHAHQLGVVHRDIKPSNLMVDSQGHLWVTDFGLALTRTDTSLTMTGGVVGTLRYMSPEQASGRRTRLDYHTDLYSLGVTLYELLTLAPAFADKDHQQLVQQILEEEPRRPRQLNQAIPKDLETIVLKAMAKDPADRYASAQEMADDLRRFQEHEPIRARRATYWQRSTKWCHRHPAWVAASAACGVLLIVVLSVATALISRAQWQAIQDRDEANRQRRRAAENFDLARQAVDHMSTRVASGVLSDQLAPTKLQRDLLEQAVVFYEELTQENDDSPLSLADQGAVLLKLSYVTNELEQFERSEAAARKAIKIYEDLAARHADNPQHRLHLARAWRYLAYAVGDMQGSGLPSAHIDNSAAVLEKLVEDHPTFAEGYEELARAIHHLAARANAAGDRQAAEKILRRAAELIEQSAALGNTSSRLRMTRAHNIGGIGAFLAREDPPAGEAMLRKALAIAQSMVEEDPDDPNYLHHLNGYYTSLASVLERMGRVEEANGLYRKATDNWRKLVTKYPGVIDYRMGLSHMLHRQAIQHIAAGDNAQAESLCRDAIEMQQTIQTLSPCRRMERPLAASHETLANTLAHQGRFGEALVEAEQGLGLLEGLIVSHSQDANFSQHLARQRHQVARLLLEKKIFDGDAADRARRLAQSAVDAIPQQPAYRMTLWLANLRTGHWLGASSSREFSEFARRDRFAQWSLAAANLKLGRPQPAVNWLHAATSTSHDRAAPIPASSSE